MRNRIAVSVTLLLIAIPMRGADVSRSGYSPRDARSISSSGNDDSMSYSQEFFGERRIMRPHALQTAMHNAAHFVSYRVLRRHRSAD